MTRCFQVFAWPGFACLFRRNFTNPVLVICLRIFCNLSFLGFARLTSPLPSELSAGEFAMLPPAQACANFLTHGWLLGSGAMPAERSHHPLAFLPRKVTCRAKPKKRCAVVHSG